MPSPTNLTGLQKARSHWALACSGLAIGLTPLAALSAEKASDKALAQQVQELLDRVQQLEARNQSLERRIEGLSKAATPASAGRGADSPDGADARLKSIEQQQQVLEQQVQALVRPPEPEEDAVADVAGPTFEGSLLGVYQQVNRKGSDRGSSLGRFSYRGDLTASMPAGTIGDARGSVFGHLRFGQGNGVALRPTHTGTVNSTTFDAAGSDDTHAIVAQAYYQLEWPLDGGRFNDQPGNRVEMTVGKLDIFAFFDQNAVAGDEASAFLNNVFVHNPLLDSGGDIAADTYGFAPGARVAYVGEGEEFGWGASVGVFASGEGAKFNASPGQPLVIAQFSVTPKQINGEARGNYRLYAWTNGRTGDFEGREARHTGFGWSVDQRVGREWNLFGRYGQRLSGHGAFDRALTVGFEHGGHLWGRGHDAVGLAVGSLSTSNAWRRATGADNDRVGFRSSGQERIAELYYRLTLSDTLSITPDFQLIHRPGGDGRAPVARVFGVRASLGF